MLNNLQTLKGQAELSGDLLVKAYEYLTLAGVMDSELLITRAASLIHDV